MCVQHPGFDSDVVVTMETTALAEVFAGTAEWRRAVADGRIEVVGPSHLVRPAPLVPVEPVLGRHPGAKRCNSSAGRRLRSAPTNRRCRSPGTRIVLRRAGAGSGADRAQPPRPSTSGIPASRPTAGGRCTTPDGGSDVGGVVEGARLDRDDAGLGISDTIGEPQGRAEASMDVLAVVVLAGLDMGAELARDRELVRQGDHVHRERSATWRWQWLQWHTAVAIGSPDSS